MSKIIILIEPAEGHFNPFVPIIKALVARGHEIVCITGSHFQQRTEALGVNFIPLVERWDPKEKQVYDFFPELKNKKGLAQLKFYLKHILFAQIPDVLQQLQTVLKDFSADVILCDTFMLAGNWISELGGPPSVRLSVLPLSLPSKGLAPFGLGLLPGNSMLRKLRNNLLNILFEKLLFKDVQTHANQIRQELGLAAFKQSFFRQGYEIPDLVLHTSVPELEYPRTQLPNNFKFIGALLSKPDPDYNLPKSWSNLPKDRPVILLNQGTVANNLDELILPAIAALKGEAVTVLIVSLPDGQIQNLASNIYTAAYIPFGNLLPHIDIMISNGGFGGTQQALAHGIPVIIAGATEDKMEVAARVDYSGAGINLGQSLPTAETIKVAVQRLLTEPKFKQQAKKLQTIYAQYDAATLAVQAIEQLIKENRTNV